jgi:hypothetical protein
MKTITLVEGHGHGPVVDLELPENQAITAVSADCRAYGVEATFVIQATDYDHVNVWETVSSLLLPPYGEGTVRAEVNAEKQELVRWAVFSLGGTHYVNFKTEENE